MKDFSLVNIVNYVTEFLVSILKKIGKMVNNKNSHDIVFIFTKVLVTILLIALLDLPFSVFKELGCIIIYKVGSVFRQFLCSIWTFIVYFSYFITGLVLLLKVFDEIFKNKELNIIEENRRKDAVAKKKVFLPIISAIRTIIFIITIPIMLCLLIILLLIVNNLMFIINGYGLISVLISLIGIFVMLLTTLILIINIAKGEKK